LRTGGYHGGVCHPLAAGVVRTEDMETPLSEDIQTWDEGQEGSLALSIAVVGLRLF